MIASKKITLFIATTAMIVATAALNLFAAGSRVAAFSGVRWNGDVPQVRVNGKWYELIAMNDQSAADIVSFAKTTYGADSMGGLPLWQKRFAEDMGDVMIAMGHPLGNTVKLDLRDQASNEVITIPDAPMTEDNRRAILSQELGAAPAATQRNEAASHASPFADIRWRGNTPEVKVNDMWYELVSIDQLPAKQITDFAQQRFGDPWKQRFAESLGDVLSTMNHPVKDSVALQLRTLDTQELVTLPSVPMTEANARSTRSQPRGGAPFSGVRWKGDVPEVEVNARWYTLIAINDQLAANIVQFAKSTYRNDIYGDQPLWQKRFSEDLGEVMSRMGHPLADTAKLDLHDLKTDEESTREVPLTEANRDAILAQRGVSNPQR